MKQLSYFLLAILFILPAHGCSSVDTDIVVPPPPSEAGWNESATGNAPSSIYNWGDVAESAHDTLQKYYWRAPYTCYYEDYGISTSPRSTTFHYWLHAHALECLMNAWQRTGSAIFKTRLDGVVQALHDRNQNTYINYYYDDMCWAGLALMRATEIFDDNKYQEIANQLWTDVKGGWNADKGGINWNKGASADSRDGKACTNWGAALLATKMYLKYGRLDDYQWAHKIYNWSTEHLYEPIRGLSTGSQGDGIYLTYNQGTLIGASLAMFRAEGDPGYLQTAIKAADYLVSPAYTATGIWRDEGETGTNNSNNGVFKGILVYYMTELINHPRLPQGKRTTYIRFLENNAITLYNAAKSNLLFSGNWTVTINPNGSNSAYKGTYLASMLSGIYLFESLSNIQDNYPELLTK